jgi:phosphatidylglycerophosphate synthase
MIFANNLCYCFGMKAWLQQLHKGAEWYAVPDEERTSLQRLAYRSLGLATLPNIATLVGAAVAIAGLFVFQGGAFGWGLFLVWLGRVCDLLDGFLARRTQTSSPFGEGLDASTDKLVILLAAIVLVSMAVVPVQVAAVLLLEQLCIAVLVLYARSKGITLHPIRLGKYTTFGIWIMVLLYLAAYWIGHTTAQSGAAEHIAASLMAMIVIIAGAVSAWRYATILQRKMSVRKVR